MDSDKELDLLQQWMEIYVDELIRIKQHKIGHQ